MTIVELLFVPGCPHVEAARRLLDECASMAGVDLQVTEREGPYPSPTILVEGTDVMGAPESDRAACRLDVPTRERLVAALVRCAQNS